MHIYKRYQKTSLKNTCIYFKNFSCPYNVGIKHDLCFFINFYQEIYQGGFHLFKGLVFFHSVMTMLEWVGLH